MGLQPLQRRPLTDELRNIVSLRHRQALVPRQLHRRHKITPGEHEVPVGRPPEVMWDRVGQIRRDAGDPPLIPEPALCDGYDPTPSDLAPEHRRHPGHTIVIPALEEIQQRTVA